MSSLGKQKLISICLFGRNDNYMPDFLYRMETTINFVAQSVKRLGRLDDIEVIVLDWGSTTPLSQALSLSQEATSICRFILVRAEEHGKIPVCSALNIAIQRSRGDYIAMCGADALIPTTSFQAIFNVIAGNSSIKSPEKKYFNCGRHVLPHEVVESQPDIDAWQRFLRLNSWKLPKQSAYGGFLYGNAGFLLMHRDVLFEAKGLSESLNYGWGWNDIDLTLRLLHKYQWYDLGHEGFILYDMEHSPTEGTRVKEVKEKPPHFIAASVTENGQWGLVDYEIVEQCSAYRANSGSQVEAVSSKRCSVEPEDMSRVADFLVTYQKHVAWCSASLQEQRAMVYLSAYARVSCQIPKLLDFNSIHGLSVFFFASLFPWGEIYSATNWKRIDDKSGPHEFSKILGSNYIGHQGYLSVLSGVTQKSLDDYWYSLKDDVTTFDLIVIRDQPTDSLDVTALIERLSKSAMMIVFPQNDHDRVAVNSAITSASSSELSVHQDESGFMVVTKGIAFSNTSDMDFSSSAPLQVEPSELDQYLAVVEFCERVKKLKSEKRILWGLGSVGRIVFDLIPTPVAIVDNGLYAKGETSYKGVPLISTSQIGEYEIDSILISAVNHYEAIYQEAKHYSSKIERVFF
ncbi:hypothetical protein MAQ5080_00252 [Marinomonas aquimarina]|uniref:Glycosyltransferase 2-like domain-containing protein n=1 Tax=Marinomonas aquimarina TaxID=295068 RepID=A0A1A8T0K3_9GAMM|nr:glycosyltransferase [Marinomonas aquimarina]SBS25391.1 hypothetical protein MAQ5080_00252 [Marinomonas aquimarina]